MGNVILIDAHHHDSWWWSSDGTYTRGGATASWNRDTGPRVIVDRAARFQWAPPGETPARTVLDAWAHLWENAEPRTLARPPGDHLVCYWDTRVNTAYVITGRYVRNPERRAIHRCTLVLEEPNRLLLTLDPIPRVYAKTLGDALERVDSHTRKVLADRPDVPAGYAEPTL